MESGGFDVSMPGRLRAVNVGALSRRLMLVAKAQAASLRPSSIAPETCDIRQGTVRTPATLPLIAG